MRNVEEWIGKTDDQAIPPRVRLRVFERTSGNCAECTRRLQPGGWACDHIVALVNGGQHRESNLRALCNEPCHSSKTAQDVAEKSKVRRKRAKHVGIKRSGRKIPGSVGTGIRKPINGPAYRVSE
jgi:5-methylcytosine-specific restriction enzyme A